MTIKNKINQGRHVVSKYNKTTKKFITYFFQFIIIAENMLFKFVTHNNEIPLL